jgi:hypothetical protein
VGYFGNESSYGRYSYGQNNSVNSVITADELNQRSSKFVEITDKLTAKSSFNDVKIALGNGNHLGMTDVGSSFWFLIKKLMNSVDNYIKNRDDSTCKNMTVFKMSGFVEILLLITDNDVNSGDQPMDVLNLYWGLVRQAFQVLPYDKDGSPADAETLFQKYMPRLVVIATQGTDRTVGDPRDNRILNINGFDSCVPILIDSFINKNKPNGGMNPLDVEDTE